MFRTKYVHHQVNKMSLKRFTDTYIVVRDWYIHALFFYVSSLVTFLNWSQIY
jgi:hypothetical protein